MRRMRDSFLPLIGATILFAMYFLPAGATAAKNTKNLSKSPKPGTFYMSIAKDVVSINANNAPVNKIFEEIGKRTGIVIESYLGNEDKITIQFERLPLEDAIRKLAGNSVVYFAKEPKGQRQRITKIAILSAAQKQASQPGQSARAQRPMNAKGPGSVQKPFKFEFDPSRYMKPQ